MDKIRQERISEEEANRILGEILDEDNLNDDDDEDDYSSTDEARSCAGNCATAENIIEKVKSQLHFTNEIINLILLICGYGIGLENKFCECIQIAENSSRFSLRVMEAMRWLQENEETLIPTCSAEEIVDYIQKNYRDDGDLYSQVRTTLKQVCLQGFVIELVENEYHLVGPDATSINQFTCSNEPQDCALSVQSKKPRHRGSKKNKDIDCDFEMYSKDEPTYTGDLTAKEVLDRSCSSSLTDDECACNGKMQKNGINTLGMQEGSWNILNNNDVTVHKRKQIGGNSQRKKGSVGTSSRMIVGHDQETPATSRVVNDIYKELEIENSGRMRTDEKELKDWIKHCQEECIRRSKRQSKNS